MGPRRAKLRLECGLERASASNWAPSESHWAQVGPTGTAQIAGPQPDPKKIKHLTLSNHLQMVLDLLYIYIYI